MLNRYLLDTNILSDLIKNPKGLVARKIEMLPPKERDALSTSIIVASELRYGATKKGSHNLSARIDQLLGAIDVLPLEVEADRHYGEIRTALERVGAVIGANDLLIAAHALAVDAVLVTDNLREFSRIEGLRIEDWLRG